MPTEGGRPWRLNRGRVFGWTRDSRAVYYTSNEDYYIYRKPFDDPQAEATKVLYNGGYYAAISPCERYIAYEQSGYIRIVEQDTQRVIGNWEHPEKERGTGCLVEWSPDSREISISDQVSMGLWIYDLRTRTARKVLSGPIARGLWSQDRARLFFELRAPYYEIWVADLDPSSPTLQSLGPSRTITEHYQEMVARDSFRMKADPANSAHAASRDRFQSNLLLLDIMQDEALKDFEASLDLPNDRRGAGRRLLSGRDGCPVRAGRQAECQIRSVLFAKGDGPWRPSTAISRGARSCAVPTGMLGKTPAQISRTRCSLIGLATALTSRITCSWQWHLSRWAGEIRHKGGFSKSFVTRTSSNRTLSRRYGKEHFVRPRLSSV